MNEEDRKILREFIQSHRTLETVELVRRLMFKYNIQDNKDLIIRLIKKMLNNINIDTKMSNSENIQPMTNIEIVRTLNLELFEKNHNHCCDWFSYCTDGLEEIITYGDFLLWSTDTEQRKFNEEKNEYEPSLIEHVRQQFNEYIDDMNKLKFVLE